MEETLSVGAVIADTFAILRRRWAVLIPLAVLLLGVPQALPWAVALASSGDLGAVKATTAGAGVLDYVLQVVFYGATTHAALAAVDDRPGAFRTSLGRGCRMFFGVFAVSVRSGLGIAVASLLLVVPGVMLFCTWAVVLPAYVAEGRIMGPAFARSRELTRGHRWRILGLTLVYVVVTVALFVPTVLAVLLPGFGPDTDALSGIQNVALDASLLLGEVGFVALYAALRRIHDGAPAVALAAAFE